MSSIVLSDAQVTAACFAAKREANAGGSLNDCWEAAIDAVGKRQDSCGLANSAIEAALHWYLCEGCGGAGCNACMGLGRQIP